MLICDTHADTLYAMQKQNPSLPLDITYARLQSRQSAHRQDTRVQALALFTGPLGLKGDPGLIRRELDMLEALKAEGFRQITAIQDALPGQPNILLTVEGGEVFHGSVETVEEYFALGVRAAALVWNHPNDLAYPAMGKENLGLTPYGKKVAQRMRELGMAVDVSHMNPRGVFDVLEMGPPAPMASHSCAHALCAHPRNLTDSQLRALFAAGGYVGVNFYPPFLCANGHASADTVVDHIAHMCALGGAKHVGLGSDFDGIDEYPNGLRHAGDIYNLFARMEARGFSKEETEAIAGKNLQAYLERISIK